MDDFLLYVGFGIGCEVDYVEDLVVVVDVGDEVVVGFGVVGYCYVWEEIWGDVVLFVGY